MKYALPFRLTTTGDSKISSHVGNSNASCNTIQTMGHLKLRINYLFWNLCFGIESCRDRNKHLPYGVSQLKFHNDIEMQDTCSRNCLWCKSWSRAKACIRSGLHGHRWNYVFKSGSNRVIQGLDSLRRVAKSKSEHHRYNMRETSRNDMCNMEL